MLPKVMDAAQFQHACGIDSGAFTRYAVSGMLPKALGIYCGQPIWDEPNVQQFAALTGLQWNDAWGDVSLLTEAAQSAPAPAAQAAPDDVPAAGNATAGDAFTQADACVYLDVSPSWLKKQEDSGIISGEKFSGFKLYLRGDLDALRSLPVYRFRKRHGYSHGKPKGPEVGKPQPQKMAGPDDFIGESAAADFLNLPRETLALARNDGGGPVCVYSNGSPKYRVSDLQAWKEQHAPQRKVAQVIRSTDYNMTASAAAEYLGITRKQLENLITHSKPGRPAPPFKSQSLGGNRGTGRHFSAQGLEEWKRDHPERHAQLQKQGGAAAGRRPRTGLGAQAAKVAEARGARGRSKVLGNVTKRLEKAPAKPTSRKRPTASRVEVRA